MNNNLALPRTTFSLITVITTTFMCVAALTMMTGCGDDKQHTSKDQLMSYNDQLVTSPKSQYPHAQDWVECQCDGTDLMFCQEPQPGYGVSIIDFHGWRRVSSKNGWERMVYARFGGLGSAKIHLNEASTSCSLRGSANNKFHDKEVIAIDLQTAIR